jgi:hypothetical protein
MSVVAMQTRMDRPDWIMYECLIISLLLVPFLLFLLVRVKKGQPCFHEGMCEWLSPAKADDVWDARAVDGDRIMQRINQEPLLCRYMCAL